MQFQKITKTKSSIIKKLIIYAGVSLLIYLVAFAISLGIMSLSNDLYNSLPNVIAVLLTQSYPVIFIIVWLTLRKRFATPPNHLYYVIEDIQEQAKLYLNFEDSGDIPIGASYWYAEDDEKLWVKAKLPTGMENDRFKKAIPLFENALRFRAIKVEQEFNEITVCFLKKEKQASTDHLYTIKERGANPYPVFGFTTNGEEIVWNYDEEPHLGVYAPPGSGKSVFTKQVVKQLADLGAEMKFIDFKRVEFGPLKKFGYEVANNSEQAFAMITEFQDEMMRRYDEMENMGVVLYRKLKYQPMFLVFDEFASMADSFPADKDGKAKKATFMAMVGDIVRLGRAAGVFLIVVTQRPDASILPGEIRANLNKSVVLRGGDNTIRRMAFGDSYSDLSPLQLGYAYVNNVDVIETVKIPFYNPEDFINDMGEAI
jgi:hypothetical protein